MGSKKSAAERKRLNQIRLDQKVVNACYERITGKSAAAPALKMATKVNAIFDHYGADRILGPVGSMLSAAADIARADGFKAKPLAQKRFAIVAKPTVTVGAEFYESWGWKEARFAALKRHGRQCQCCGWTPGASAGNHLVVDHIKPLRTHPQLARDPENHQVLCNDCNMGKSYKHHDDFR